MSSGFVAAVGSRAMESIANDRPKIRSARLSIRGRGRPRSRPPSGLGGPRRPRKAQPRRLDKGESILRFIRWRIRAFRGPITLHETAFAPRGPREVKK